jgi:hypothetical protein
VWERSDLAERNPEPPTGGEAQTVLLCDAKVCDESHATDGVRAIFQSIFQPFFIFQYELF